MNQNTPGCYLDTAAAITQNLISKHTFFHNCLSHIGPSDVRAYHPEDRCSVDEQINPIFWKGALGPVAAALKLCESDMLAASVDGTSLVSLFISCTTSGESVDSIVVRDNQGILNSPLFFQALMVTALRSGNVSLARDLVRLTSHVPPPPPQQCVFTMHASSLVDDNNIPAVVWTALVNARWAPPSHKLVMHAVSSNGEDGLELLRALRNAGFNMHGNPTYRQILPSLALAASDPELLEYLWNLYSVAPPNNDSDLLIRAIEFRRTGGVEMLRWLLDRYNLDVNFMRVVASAEQASNRVTDPRDRAEQEAAATGQPSRQRTALHAAALQGNLEAVQFLLERGAVASLEDGHGQTALALAEIRGYQKVVQALEQHL